LQHVRCAKHRGLHIVSLPKTRTPKTQLHSFRPFRTASRKGLDVTMAPRSLLHTATHLNCRARLICIRAGGGVGCTYRHIICIGSFSLALSHSDLSYLTKNGIYSRDCNYPRRTTAPTPFRRSELATSRLCKGKRSAARFPPGPCLRTFLPG
jgi:hypothetical protein